MDTIYYKKGYKYQIVRDYRAVVDFKPSKAVATNFINFNLDGRLLLKSYYAWDGPTGVPVHIKSLMRSSLEHDAFYQLMRQGLLPPSFRKKVDKRFRKVCIKDGMWRINAATAYRLVRVGGRSAIKPKNRKLIIIAP